MHFIVSNGLFPSGFITTSDLISFSYAVKSQVRQTVWLILGRRPDQSDWAPGINLRKSAALT